MTGLPVSRAGSEGPPGGGIGHNPPQDAPAASAQAIMDVNRL
jgi:hypothetical protein